MSSKRNVTYKCPYCNSRYNRVDLVTHIEENHEDMIPEDFTAFRLVFNYVNKKPLSYHGKCTECGGPTPWDEKKGRYDRQCEKPACKASYIKKFEENMMKTRGVTRISATEEGQKKMLASRKISGKYKFRDGTLKDYCGSYELKALEFMDKVLEIKSSDILSPGPILEYSYEGKTHIYITDFYYQPYNLIIEVKDGGDNPNKRNMPEYRAKQIAKEQYIIKHTNFNYIRLTNNDFSQLISVFMDLKLQMVENTGERVIHVNESENNPITEMMNALMTGKVVGMKDSDAYIVNYMQNNVFSGEPENRFAITNNIKMDTVYGLDKDNTFRVIDRKSISNPKFYDTGLTTKEVSKRLKPYIGTKMESSEDIYKIACCKENMYTQDELDAVLTRVKDDVKNTFQNKIYDYLIGDNVDSEITDIVKALDDIRKKWGVSNG